MKNISIKKYDYIDALRGFAILGVVLVHTSHWVAPTSEILNRIADEGARGVQLFFLASALTLFLSMGARREQEERPLLSFFIRRFFRIAPLFYLAIIVFSVWNGMTAHYWSPNGVEWWYIPLTALFLHGWHPETVNAIVPGGWSIAVEMTFYVMVPYLFLKLKNIKLTLAALFFSLLLSKLLSIIVVYLFSSQYAGGHQYVLNGFTLYWFFSQLPIFLLGILLYHIIKKYPQNDNRTALFLLFVSLFLFFAFLSSSTFKNLLPRHFLYGIAFLIFALSLHYSPQKLLVNWVTILIGKLSFSIYLVHFGVLLVMQELFSNGFILNGDAGFLFAFLLVLAVSICISYVTHYTIEIPGINLGKKIIKKL